MTRFMILTGVALAMVISTLLFSCDSESKKTYDVDVEWRINRVQECEAIVKDGGQLNFSEIVITVWDDEDDIAEGKDPIAVEDGIDCGDFEYTLSDMDRGKYFVVVEAIADYEGQELPYFQGSEELTVPSDDPTEVDLYLSVGKVTAVWGFENRRMCGANDVEEVRAYLRVGSDEEDSGPIDCELGEFVFENLDWDYYELEIEGMDANGEVTHRGTYIADVEDNPSGDAGDDDAGPEDENLLDVRPGSDIEAFVELVAI